MTSIVHFVLSCLLVTHFLFRVGAKARVIGLLSISFWSVVFLVLWPALPLSRYVGYALGLLMKAVFAIVLVVYGEFDYRMSREWQTRPTERLILYLMSISISIIFVLVSVHFDSKSSCFDTVSTLNYREYRDYNYDNDRLDVRWEQAKVKYGWHTCNRSED